MAQPGSAPPLAAAVETFSGAARCCAGVTVGDLVSVQVETLTSLELLDLRDNQVRRGGVPPRWRAEAG